MTLQVPSAAVPSTIEDLSRKLSQSICDMITTTAAEGCPMVVTAGGLRHLTALIIGSEHPSTPDAIDHSDGAMQGYDQALQSVEPSNVSEVIRQVALMVHEGSEIHDFGLSSPSIPVATVVTPRDITAGIAQHRPLAAFHETAAQKRSIEDTDRPEDLEDFIIQHEPFTSVFTQYIRERVEEEKEITRNKTKGQLSSTYDRVRRSLGAEDFSERWAETDLISTLVAEDGQPCANSIDVANNQTVLGPDSMVDLSAIRLGTYEGSTFDHLLPRKLVVDEAQNKVVERKARTQSCNPSSWAKLIGMSPSDRYPLPSSLAESTTSAIRKMTLEAVLQI
ncbi:hypothetical protein I317_01431 [Kwoniella heveanensis CBS 569]|nr:hypothetical protein I317_01431 [Kwoniella heveanensis CBS 569]